MIARCAAKRQALRVGESVRRVRRRMLCSPPTPPWRQYSPAWKVSSVEGLRRQWRNHLGGEAPAHLPRWLLVKVLGHRLQVAALEISISPCAG